jgi:hypothetical protein
MDVTLVELNTERGVLIMAKDYYEDDDYLILFEQVEHVGLF